MVKNIRCIIVDDSALSRKIVRTALESIPGTEVVAVCRDGLDGVERCTELKPDFVTMDIEMPRMNGIEAVRELKVASPQAKVVMVSSLTASGAEITTEALRAGAFDFVLKPVAQNVDDCIRTLAVQLSEKISMLKEMQGVATTGPASPLGLRSRFKPEALQPKSAYGSGISNRSTSMPNVDAICIGVSTGGPVALGRLLPQLPANLPVPIYIVQHMPPVFTKSLAMQLDSTCALKVVEAEDGMSAMAGQVYIAPGGQQMKVEANAIAPRIRVTHDPAESNARPSVDYLFRHAAKAHTNRLLAIMLTGMGQDGLLGCQQIKSSGGYIISQDAASCVVYGMPRVVAEAGLSDQVLNLDRIASTIVELTTKGAASCL